MSFATKRSAVVIGGSMSGLLTARVLADHFDQVTIVERDRMNTAAELRAGVPQGYHAHALLVRGRQIMENLLPGLEDDLVAQGTHKLDMAESVLIRFKSGWTKRMKSGLDVFSMSRPLLEGRVRSHVLSHAKITVREGVDVLGLLGSEDRSTVTGIEVRERGSKTSETLYADLVVDASGRSAKTPEWLAELGYEKPEETAIDAFVGYSTRWYEIPADFAGDWQGMWIQSVPPVLPRGGILIPIEGNRWQVTLFGIGKDYPPTDDEGFLAFARSLASTRLYDAIKNATAITPAHGYRNTINRMRHYDKLERFPERLIVIGDAYAHFNPTYGQGMTVAALSADALATLLRERNGALDGLGREFQKRAAKVLAPAWMMTTTEDLRWNTTVGGKHTMMTRVMHWYTGAILALIPEDEAIYRAFLPVQHMLRPATTLFAPRILAKVIAFTLRRERKQPAIMTTQELKAVRQG
ncbi:MAG: FAD-dependent monooxygenase [Anaerolinea sp.]|nr:FAD-dependent monooxygenase [Anaerolinea sp.]